MKIAVDFYPKYDQVKHIITNFMENSTGCDAAELQFWLEDKIVELRVKNEDFFDTKYTDRVNQILERYKYK